MKTLKLIFVTFVSAGVLSGCNGGHNQTNIEIIQNMMDQINVKAQDWDPEHPDQVQGRMPPEHTISREMVPYAFKTDAPGGWKQANPYAENMSAEFLTLGAKYYTTYCLPCHGSGGAADGLVAAKMPVKPRNLISDDAKAYPDGRIFHAISAGYGVMGSYATQITDPKNRWAVVNYVRSLQKQAH
jgi:mono/diheme cytochrome c family protein